MKNRHQCSVHHIAAFLLLLLLPTTKAQAGWLFSDPLEIEAKPIPHVLSKDELHFTLAGKCKDWFVYQPEVTLELRTGNGIRKIVHAQQFWASNSPLVFKLPVPYSEVNSFALKGKFRLLGLVKIHPKGKHSLEDGTRFDITPIKGYKIDSRWTTK